MVFQGSFYNNFEWLQGKWQTQMQLNVILMQQKGFLKEQKKNAAAAVGVAVNYNMTSRLWWVLQYDAHTALFNKSNKKPLGHGQMLSVAVAWRGKSWGSHFAILEDIDVDSVPDIGFQFGLQKNL